MSQVGIDVTLSTGVGARMEPGVSIEANERTTSRWRAWLLGILLVAALAVAALRWGNLRNFVELLRRAEPAWLARAFVLQPSTYASLSVQ